MLHVAILPIDVQRIIRARRDARCNARNDPTRAFLRPQGNFLRAAPTHHSDNDDLEPRVLVNREQKPGREGSIERNGESIMAERVSGPYRGYYISAAARLVTPPPAAESHDAGRGPVRPFQARTDEPGDLQQRGGSEPHDPRGGVYVGSVSLSLGGLDTPRRIETLLELGDGQRFACEDDALDQVEQAAREYIDRLYGEP